jgi:hypothetical protein
MDGSNLTPSAETPREFRVHKGAQACISAGISAPPGGKVLRWICRTLIRNARTARLLLFSQPVRHGLADGGGGSMSVISEESCPAPGAAGTERLACIATKLP